MNGEQREKLRGELTAERQSAEQEVRLLKEQIQILQQKLGIQLDFLKKAVFGLDALDRLEKEEKKV